MHCNVYNIIDQSVCISCILGGVQLDHFYHTHFGSYTDELKAFVVKHYVKVNPWLLQQYTQTPRLYPVLLKEVMG